MIAALCVGAGGFVGAVLRYLVTLVPFPAGFPFATFAVNLLGSFVIGAIVGAVEARPGALSPNMVLFLKTGVCGGFTTFSTFSLETLGFLDEGAYGMAALYAGASLVCCVIGVILGRMMALRLGKI